MRGSGIRLLHLLCVLAVVIASSCGDDGGTDGGADGGTAAGGTAGEGAAEAAVEGCDPLDPAACLLPFPNDAFTVADDDSPTGRRLALPEEGLPTNADDEPMAADDLERSDGFSPGSPLLVLVPDLDVDASGIVASTHVGSSLDDDAPVLLVDTATGERVPHWAELDAQADDDATRLLMIRPAVALDEGATYAVGLRELRSGDGEPLEPSEGWQQVVDGTLEPQARLEHLQEVEAVLDEAAGADEDWWIAWDFTVASTEGLSERLLHIRDEAYEELGEGAPPFTVLTATDEAGARVVSGTYEVPLFLDSDQPGGTFSLDEEGLPARGDGPLEANFICVLPIDPAEPASPIVYGHGLLGSAEEVRSLAEIAPLGNLAACATDWIGMSSADLPVVAEILGDLSLFPSLPDRLQQSHLNMSFLGRLLNAEDGFASDEAFQDGDGETAFAVGDTQFVGNSQGGILGGASSAVTTEWERAVFGVPGMNYSLLLTRSSNWPQFAAVFEEAYTDDIERALALAIIQVLWDRGENQGYAQHLTDDPYEGIEPKDVLLIAAYGDHQVANVATDVFARTIGARVHTPMLEEGRSDDVEPGWGLEPLGDDREGSAYAMWDFGTPPPPPDNQAPSPPEHGEDPHGAGTQELALLAQAFGFLDTGEVPDVCEGPCVSTALTG
jgi:hypothetical protein